MFAFKVASMSLAMTCFQNMLIFIRSKQNICTEVWDTMALQFALNALPCAGFENIMRRAALQSISDRICTGVAVVSCAHFTVVASVRLYASDQLRRLFGVLAGQKGERAGKGIPPGVGDCNPTGMH